MMETVLPVCTDMYFAVGSQAFDSSSDSRLVPMNAFSVGPKYSLQTGR